MSKLTWWRLIATALIARMAGLLKSIGLLANERRPSDSGVLVRALYEHVVIFCWLAIDPGPRVDALIDHARVRRRALHDDARQVGIDDLLSPEDLEMAAAAARLLPLDQLATEVDEHWSRRIRSFRPPHSGASRHPQPARPLHGAVQDHQQGGTRGGIEPLWQPRVD